MSVRQIKEKKRRGRRKGRTWSQSREVCRSEKEKKADENTHKKSREEENRGEDRVANQ